jgi:hypothetical protein
MKQYESRVVLARASLPLLLSREEKRFKMNHAEQSWLTWLTATRSSRDAR